jgi:hypothetical protein
VNKFGTAELVVMASRSASSPVGRIARCLTPASGYKFLKRENEMATNQQLSK